MFNTIYFSFVSLFAAILLALVYKRPASTMSAPPTPPVVFPTVTLFGDSITQQAWQVDGLGAHLQDVYQRKMDVLNRGLSGYNTAWAIPIAKEFLPKYGGTSPTNSLMTVWFGANDAAIPPSPQGLTIAQFKENLHTIISLVRSPNSPNYSPTTKILLITPPPVDAFTRNAELMSRDPPRVPDRDSERTQDFAKAVIEVGKESETPVADVWSAITNAAAQNGGLDKYLSDGLHLTGDGYVVVFQVVSELIRTTMPALYWDNIEQTFPHWTDIIHNGALGPQYLAPQP